MHVQFCFAVTKLEMKNKKFGQTHLKRTQGCCLPCGLVGPHPWCLLVTLIVSKRCVKINWITFSLCKTLFKPTKKYRKKIWI